MLGVLAAIWGVVQTVAPYVIGGMVVGSTVYGVVSTEQQKADSRRLEAKNDAMYAAQESQIKRGSDEISAILKDAAISDSSNETAQTLTASYVYQRELRNRNIYSYGKTSR